MSAGFSPALGFVHTGKMLSFVYDIADLYKADVTIPIAFQAVAEMADNLERKVRIACRDRFVSERLLEKIIPDLQNSLLMNDQKGEIGNEAFDHDAAAPGLLWDPVIGGVDGGCNYPLHLTDEEVTDGCPDS